MNIFSNSASLYFYSALLQGNAALIALVAVFLIYRKQYFDSLLDKREKILINYYEGATGTISIYGDFDFETYNEESCKDLNEETKLRVKSLVESIPWKEAISELRNIKSQGEMLWKNARLPMILMFLMLISNVVMLPLSDLVHMCIWLEGAGFIIFGISEIGTLILLYKFIRGQLNN